MPNKANIAQVRDMILDAPQHFNMQHLISSKANTYQETLENLHTCGTTACIAGWAAYAAGYRGNDNEQIEVIAAEYLGLDTGDEPFYIMVGGEARKLFYPPIIYRDDDDGDAILYYQATAEEAAVVLNHLIETGEVKWDLVSPSSRSSQD